MEVVDLQWTSKTRKVVVVVVSRKIVCV